jgi:phenylalanyl-tRNA synthetase beta chain
MNNGVKPINVTLDILSYISLLTAVPTAIYDEKFVGDEFKVDFANIDMQIEAINNKTYTLDSTDIVILSNDKILSLAGIVGNKQFGINKDTKNAIVEIANFNYTNIRKTNIKLDINTKASKIFSKQLSNYLLSLTLTLIEQHFPKQNISKPIVNLQHIQPKSINIDLDNIKNFIGVDIKKDIIKKSLSYYGFNFDGDSIVPPPHRLDILIEQDVSEEIVKFININLLKESKVTGNIIPVQTSLGHKNINHIKKILINNYVQEVRTYNLTNESDLENFNIFKYTKFLKIQNTNNGNRKFLRSNLISKMLNVYKFNNNHRSILIPIFEIQDIYLQNETHKNLTVLFPENVVLDHIGNSKIIFNVNALKSILKEISSYLNIELEYFSIPENDFFYPNESLSINFLGVTVGFIGLIKTSVLKQ